MAKLKTQKNLRGKYKREHKKTLHVFEKSQNNRAIIESMAILASKIKALDDERNLAIEWAKEIKKACEFGEKRGYIADNTLSQKNVDGKRFPSLSLFQWCELAGLGVLLQIIFNIDFKEDLK